MLRSGSGSASRSLSTEFDPGWRDCPTCYHATYSIMAGLAGLDISLPDSTDWFRDLTETLMAEQTGEGGWTASCFDDSEGLLSTAWAILTLQRASLPSAVKYTLAIAISPENGGSVAGSEVDCPGDCGGGYLSGTEVPLEAFPGDGYDMTRARMWQSWPVPKRATSL